MEFLNSLKERLKYYPSPFEHWELNKPLTQDAINEICKTEIMDLTKKQVKLLSHGVRFLFLYVLSAHSSVG